MARTSSVAERQNFAAAVEARAFSQIATQPFELLKRGSPERHALLVTVFFLAATGIAVPYLDVQTLSTLLVVAGAGLASLLLFLPWRAVTHSIGAEAPRTAILQKARFLELTRGYQSSVDRIAWARLTTQMSHELRTPLNAVLGFSELMSNEVFGPLGSSCYSAYARDIHSSGRLLLKSAEDALAITALLTGPDGKRGPAVTSLGSAVEEALAFAGPDLVHRNIKVECLVGDGFDVIADPQAARQMLINLLADAIKTCRDGATIAIRAGDTQRGTRLSISVPADQANDARESDTFSITLARTLCDLSGADLAKSQEPDGSTELAITFTPAAQSDLFAR